MRIDVDYTSMTHIDSNRPPPCREKSKAPYSVLPGWDFALYLCRVPYK